MDNVDESGQAQNRSATQEQARRNDSSQSNTMETVPASRSANESKSIRHNRKVNYGFFVGEENFNEAILNQLLAITEKGLKNARTFLEMYKKEEQEFLKQKDQLEQLIKLARQKRENQEDNLLLSEEE